MAGRRAKKSETKRTWASSVEFARLVAHGLREDLRRLHADLVEEESRLAALEEIRQHSMKDFELLSEQGVTTTEAALYYTLFHHLTEEITLQGRLVLNARHRVGDKQAAVRVATEDVSAAEGAEAQGNQGRVGAKRLGPTDSARWGARPSVLKKAS